MKATYYDLVEIQEVNSAIILDIKYATTDNFTQKQVYTQAKAYIRKEVALQLDKVQKELELQSLGLKVWDAYRPHQVQYIFWELVPDIRYVADPERGSRHNRGAAVDVTLVDLQGNELEMPTLFDDFTEKAHRNYTALSQQVICNRTLLEEIMTKHGFQGLSTEWWHFDYKGWEKYDLLDIPFEELT
jgi:zinc D-Ala-D-Ala dipeptidase